MMLQQYFIIQQVLHKNVYTYMLHVTIQQDMQNILYNLSGSYPMDLLLRVLHVALQVESSNELGHLATPQQKGLKNQNRVWGHSYNKPPQPSPKQYSIVNYLSNQRRCRLREWQLRRSCVCCLLSAGLITSDLVLVACLGSGSFRFLRLSSNPQMLRVQKFRIFDLRRRVQISKQQAPRARWC